LQFSLLLFSNDVLHNVNAMLIVASTMTKRILDLQKFIAEK